MVSPPDYSDAFNPVDKDTKTLEKCIAARIEGYSDLYDDELWLLFQQEFVLWTEQHLRQAPMPSLFKLRKTLRSNGVYVAKDQRHPAIPLAEARAEAERHQWTESELIQLIQQREQPNSPDLHITYGETIERLRNPTNRAPQQSAHFEQPETPSPPTATLLGPMTRQRSQLLQPQEATLKAPLTQRFYNPTTPGMTTTYEPTVPPTTPGRQDVEVSYTEQNGLSYNANISHLRKAYNEEIKYGGSEDTFDMCYRIFIELCGSTGVHTAEAMRRALWIMLKGDALQFYFDNIEKWTQLRIDPVIAVKNNYENEEHLRHVQEQWDTMTLPYIVSKNPEKSISECLELMLQDLRRFYNKLRPQVRNDVTYHAKLISATRLVPACHAATGKPSPTIPGLVEDLRSSVSQYEDTRQAAAQHPIKAYYTDRRYHRRQSRSPYRGRSLYQNQQQYGDRRRRSSSWNHSPKTCNVCKKVRCWSTNHTPEEREKALQPYMDRVKAYLTAKEGQPPAATNQDSPDGDEEFKMFLAGVDAPSRYETQDYESKGQSYAVNYFTIANPEHEEYSKSLTNDLANRSAAHFLQSRLRSGVNLRLSKEGTNTTSRDVAATVDTPYDTLPVLPQYSFLTEPRYSTNTFIGVLVDTGAAEHSTAGYPQYLAYRRTARNVILDTSTAGQAAIRFGPGESIKSIGSIDVPTPVGDVRFHIIEVMTPFLLSIKDMDRLGIYFDNTKNVLVGPKPGMTTPISRRFGHPFLIWDHSLKSYLTESFDTDTCFLTETELRRLHRRFGHPSVEKLRKLLVRAGHDVDTEALKHIRKFCHHCQIYGQSPGRFRFTVRDDVSFNHSIIVDIMYINGKPVLHVVDEATRFNAARWLENISAKATWTALRIMWIDTYLGPPDFIVTDAGKNFTSKEFSRDASSMDIIVTTVPVEAHWSIGAVERYHAVLRRSYEIMKEELPDISTEAALQIAVKAVNDTAGPDGLVPTLLVFGAYPRMTEYDPPAPTITQRAAAVKKAMTEIRRIRAQRQITDAVNTRNGPSSTAVHRLPLNSDVLVWREGNTGYAGKWTGPYKLLVMSNETCIIELPNGPTPFRSTAVKPYYTEIDKTTDKASPDKTITEDRTPENEPIPHEIIPPPPAVVIPQYEPEASSLQRPQRDRRLPTRYREDYMQHTFLGEFTKEHEDEPRHQFAATVLARFEGSQQKEINGLLERGVFEYAQEKDIPPGTRIFTARFVNEVKNNGTDKAFEKSRLVVQAYNDEGKEYVLTQSPTIQRASQRIILCFATIMKNVRCYIRDVTQAYIQSTTKLNRDFYIRITPELAQYFPGGTFLKVVRPLYGIPEAGNHWFRTYHNHHTENLNMDVSTYDPCLLHCSDSKQGFGIIGMQTDDTLIVANDTFAAREEEEIRRAKILCKPREQLTTDNPLKFNGAVVTETAQGITLTQKRTCSHIRPVQDQAADTTNSRGKVRKDASPQEQYIAQRALGAASYGSTKDDIKALNKRLQWQIDNPERGLRFVELDVQTLRLIAFVDASFANNKDYSSQLGYVIVLADEANNANILHWSSTKCKRITRSVLGSETYALANGFDAAAAIKSTLTQLLHLTEPLPLIVCTDSKSLYECLVKLGTTHEKRLMIDLMCLRQSYERQEITEVRWIDGNSNPADAMTKSKPCHALQELIDTNKLRINVDGWVERSVTTRSPEPKAVRFATLLESPKQ
ncbi:hypothetical protein EYB25_008294 [Talaromyces marneffei]|nr:hypothetical protein EYB25_008294 [Talaromyces marneffei]